MFQYYYSLHIFHWREQYITTIYSTYSLIHWLIIMYGPILTTWHKNACSWLVTQTVLMNWILSAQSSPLKPNKAPCDAKEAGQLHGAIPDKRRTTKLLIQPLDHITQHCTMPLQRVAMVTHSPLGVGNLASNNTPTTANLYLYQNCHLLLLPRWQLLFSSKPS
jgi:hypothetical protein